MAKRYTRTSASKWILIIGVILTILSPIILIWIYPSLVGVENAPSLGETIGGITSPFVALIGSLLLYIALTDQIEANRILSDQIEEGKEQSAIIRDLEHLSELYRLFEKNIDLFPFEIKEQNKNESKIYVGTIALSHFVDNLILTTDNPHNDEELLKDHGVNEFTSIIKSAELLIDKIKSSKITKQDKDFYKNLILHKIENNLSPNFSRIRDKTKSHIQCECGINHGRFPVKLYEELESVKQNLIQA